MAASERTDDYVATDSEVNPIEGLIEGLLPFLAENGFVLPNPFPLAPADNGGLLRDGNDLRIHLATGRDLSRIEFPGYVADLLEQTELVFHRPQSHGQFLCLHFVSELHDINLEPGAHIGTIEFNWQTNPLALRLHVVFETQDDEIVGDVTVDWNQIEGDVRLLPHVDNERLLWDWELDLKLEPKPGSLQFVKSRAFDGAKSAFRNAIEDFLKEYATLVASGLMSLPLRPVDEELLPFPLREFSWETLAFYILRRNTHYVGHPALQQALVEAHLMPNNILRTATLRND